MCAPAPSQRRGARPRGRRRGRKRAGACASATSGRRGCAAGSAAEASPSEPLAGAAQAPPHPASLPAPRISIVSLGLQRSQESLALLTQMVSFSSTWECGKQPLCKQLIKPLVGPMNNRAGTMATMLETGELLVGSMHKGAALLFPDIREAAKMECMLGANHSRMCKALHVGRHSSPPQSHPGTAGRSSWSQWTCPSLSLAPPLRERCAPIPCH